MSEEQEQLKVGDTVQLKVGGPKMSVTDVGTHVLVGMEPAAECAWFDKSDKHHSYIYPIKALVPVEQDSTKH